MKFSIDKHKPWCRVFICLVCALTLFGVFCRPIQAHATTAVITWGLSTGASMAVLPEIALIGILLIGAGWVVDNLDEFYACCQELYNSNGYVQRWAYNYASSGDIASLGQVYYDKETALAVNEYVGALQLPGLPPDDDDRRYYMVLPATFMALDTLQSSAIIMYDKATLAAVLDNKALILANNALDAQTNATVLAMEATLAEVALTVGGAVAAIETMSTDIQSKLSTSNSWFQTINSNMMTYTSKVGQEVANFKTSLIGRFDNFVDLYDTKMNRSIAVSNAINNNLMTYTSAINTSITNQTSSLIYRLDAIPTTLTSQWDKKINPLVPTFSTALEQVDLWQYAVGNKIDDGEKNIPIWLDKGNSVLTYYATPLLASTSVLGLFFDIPIISDLLYFSLALGIFALIVNLGNAVVSSSGKDATKGRKNKIGKEG